MQKHKNVMWYKRGKKGPYANKWPSGDSNEDELSTRSNLLSNILPLCHQDCAKRWEPREIVETLSNKEHASLLCFVISWQ
jgi:hypothetical protein